MTAATGSARETWNLPPKDHPRPRLDMFFSSSLNFSEKLQK